MKFFYIVLTILTVMFQYRIWFSDSNVVSMRELKVVVAEQLAENEELRTRNNKLIAEVHELKNGMESYEELARVELGMVGENETFVQIIQPGT